MTRNSRRFANIQPLAEQMRPDRIGDFYGQQHLLGKGKPLQLAVQEHQLHSMIFWGPPGTGKTTLARIIARETAACLCQLSAVLDGVKEVRSAIQKARELRRERNVATILFVDEVHRFNKAQQDALLPYLEDGSVLFIGATTENPSFAINNALLSRTRVYVFKPLSEAALNALLEKALSDQRCGLGRDRERYSERVFTTIVGASDGDARKALMLLQIVVDLIDSGETEETALNEALSGQVRRFDKGGDLFYEQISALHKAVRGSQPDAALYWFARLLDGGCDPAYIGRRLVRIASEDVGNADPRGLRVALDAWEVFERLGSPEGELALAQALIYLACAAKSNAVYKAFAAAQEDAKAYGSLEVPLHLRNAPTALLKALSHGADYRYPHDESHAYAAGESYFPQEMDPRQYYFPVRRGLEIKIGDKLAFLRDLDKNAAINASD